VAEHSIDCVVRHIRGLVQQSPGAEWTDAQLLDRYAASGDEAAFAALVQRHGRLVRAVCRHVLRQEQDVEDAVQATFLVLARKVASIRKRTALVSWLHGVAFRIALNARKMALRRRSFEQRGALRTPEQPVSEAALHELQALLDQEVQRLPEKYRAPFVLCCLEGLSKAEAARQLGWKQGTVSGRVARARERLRQGHSKCLFHFIRRGRNRRTSFRVIGSRPRLVLLFIAQDLFDFAQLFLKHTAYRGRSL
jgi:RNA polymerase sigma factor (sigma-70 family)